MAAPVSTLPPTAQLRQARRNTHLHVTNECCERYHTSLLRVAAATWSREQPAELRALLQSGSEAQQTDIQKNTCLHLLLANAHPNQYWTVHSLTTLLRAGVDPEQLNHFGCTAFDVACNAPAALGSFRRDLLLQALLEAGLDVLDDRLFSPIQLTNVYNEMRHEVLFGSRSNNSEYELQAVLHEQLTAAVEERNLNCNRDLLKPALRRVLSTYTEVASTDSATIVEAALQYLERMSEGKKQIVRLCQERIHKEDAVRLGEKLNLLQMRERANTEALLEFDWFRPVDVDDLFLSYIDNMIDQLEALKPAKGDAENIEGLIEMMQNTIPSFRELSVLGLPTSDFSVLGMPASDGDEIERADSARCLAPLDTQLEQGGSCADWFQTDGSASIDVERKASIVQTPVGFYRPEL